MTANVPQEEIPQYIDSIEFIQEAINKYSTILYHTSGLN